MARNTNIICTKLHVSTNQSTKYIYAPSSLSVYRAVSIQFQYLQLTYQAIQFVSIHSYRIYLIQRVMLLIPVHAFSRAMWHNILTPISIEDFKSSFPMFMLSKNNWLIPYRSVLCVKSYQRCVVTASQHVLPLTFSRILNSKLNG